MSNKMELASWNSGTSVVCLAENPFAKFFLALWEVDMIDGKPLTAGQCQIVIDASEEMLRLAAEFEYPGCPGDVTKDEQ